MSEFVAASKQIPAITHILRRLMDEIRIKEAELARQTCLPQTTINRLLLGDTADPRANTLKPIAKFFGITVGQLLGEEPIHPSRVSGTFSATNREAWNHIPVIAWEDAIGWIFKQESYSLHTHPHWITTEKPISHLSYALHSRSFMSPRFRENSILIVDTQANYSDGDFAVITLDHEHVTVRQLIYDHAQLYLKHFDRTLPTFKFEKAVHEILGIIVEARINLR